MHTSCEYAISSTRSPFCQDGFAEENAIYGGYNQSPATSSNELASGLLRLLDNFTLYVQTDEEGSEELVDLQDFSPGTSASANTAESTRFPANPIEQGVLPVKIRACASFKSVCMAQHTSQTPLASPA